MTNQELSRKILELVGGKSNVVSAANCMTRLRIQLKDNSKAKIAQLKATDGVLGVVEDATLPARQRRSATCSWWTPASRTV